MGSSHRCADAYVTANRETPLTGIVPYATPIGVLTEFPLKERNSNGWEEALTRATRKESVERNATTIIWIYKNTTDVEDKYGCPTPSKRDGS
jgi:hypothetical protein